MPTGVAGTAYGAVGPTQALVDAYAMNTGWYPITGYEADGTPIVEPLSGYELASELEKSSWIYPSGGWSNKADFEIEAPNMYKDREPRFYVTVFFGGNQWLHGNSATSISLRKAVTVIRVTTIQRVATSATVSMTINSIRPKDSGVI